MSSFHYLSERTAQGYCGAADYAAEFLFNALNIGEEMLKSGAEISRVEESVRRICLAYGAERVDVFTITTSIVATVYSPNFGCVTQTRRISRMNYDMWKLSRLNALARRVCEGKLAFESVEREFARICRTQACYSPTTVTLFYAVVSASFTLFFGGSPADALAAASIGLFLMGTERFSEMLGLPRTSAAVLWSFAGGCLAHLFVWMGIGASPDLISIGNIMLLIPGLQLTNSIRDMFSGDTLSAILKFSDAFLLAVLIALGFALPAMLLQGLL